MDLLMDVDVAKNYKSKSQIARVLTENWLLKNGFCPSCENNLTEVSNNARVHDFSCLACKNEFELKSFNGKTPLKVNDGAYESMIKRILDTNNPHFFFLGYDQHYCVVNCFAVPNYLIQPTCIEKRKPLAITAKRAGWVGCLIKLDQIPKIGKINLIENGKWVQRGLVKNAWDKTKFLVEQSNVNLRGWTLDVLTCIEKLNAEFSLNELYKFEKWFKDRHPDNKHVKDKIRQQLQVLRDKGIVEFVKPGVYRVIK